MRLLLIVSLVATALLSLMKVSAQDVEAAIRALPERDLQAALDEAVRQNNAHLPMRLDDRIRLDSVVTRPGKIVIYNHTYVAKASFQSKRVYFEEFLLPTIRRRALANKWRGLLAAGVKVIYRFKDTDGKFIGDAVISAGDVHGPRASNQTLERTADRR